MLNYKSRPILFTAPMIRALLDGSKTQTRRVIKHKHLANSDVFSFDAVRGEWEMGECHQGSAAHTGWMRCPYGVPGERLWVRETWGLHRFTDITDWLHGPIKNHDPRTFYDIAYRADYGLGQLYVEPSNDISSWRPSIHMPRWASRITLKIRDIRIEKLNDISEADAIAEGVEKVGRALVTPTFRDYAGGTEWISPRRSYRSLWESINGIGSWDKNPFVWVIEFNKI